MKKLNITDLHEAAEKTVLPTIAPTSANTRDDNYCFTIVNNRNGKRITLNRTLSIALGISSSVDIMPMPDYGYILVGTALPYPAAWHCKARNQDGVTTVYDSSKVQNLSRYFTLDFTEHTSLSFRTVEIDTLDGVKVAMVQMFDDASENTEVTADGEAECN